MIDLSRHYTAGLDASHVASNGVNGDNSLERFPHGMTNFGGVSFDVRGVVALRRLDLSDKTWQTIWNHYPIRATGIHVGRKLRHLHVLHGAACGLFGSARVKDGTHIGTYVWHYANGTKQEFEIVYGRDVRDWWKKQDEKTSDSDRNRPVWTGTNSWLQEYEPTSTLRLYLNTCENPQPDIEVTSIDFVSKMTQAAPFLVAMTVEP